MHVTLKIFLNYSCTMVCKCFLNIYAVWLHAFKKIFLFSFYLWTEDSLDRGYKVPGGINGWEWLIGRVRVSLFCLEWWVCICGFGWCYLLGSKIMKGYFFWIQHCYKLIIGCIINKDKMSKQIFIKMHHHFSNSKFV